ncbi:hypothetical protein EWB00_002032 [Schistosoma japonicum]|uniref:Uncharacterized protein n=1 Tax=Schistosoma japonicum TaxID=6182 RepID=A0A4Z2DDL7_SCHJA|nr:hypothetical protein EWB00_002032 [Schistosoma japonicum]
MLLTTVILIKYDRLLIDVNQFTSKDNALVVKTVTFVDVDFAHEIIINIGTFVVHMTGFGSKA